MIMSLILFENEFLNIVSISFTALVLNELIMVALEITIWCGASSRVGLGWLSDPWNFLRHVYMVIAEIATLLLYAVSIVFLPEYFGTCFYSPRTMDASEHMGLRRSVVRRLRTFRLEGGSDRCGQRFPVVCDQVHKEQDLSCGFQQTSVISIRF